MPDLISMAVAKKGKAKPKPKKVTIVKKTTTKPAAKSAANKKYNASAKKTTQPIKKAPPYADADYYDQLNALLKNAENYKANMAVQKGRIGEDYTEQLADMARQKGRDLPAIENDFAARGIVRSGLYGKRLGEYEEDFQDALGDLGRQQSRALQDVSMGYNNYLEQWRLQKQQAIKAAIQRKLAKQKK
jgi:hypothetical protein